MRAWPDSSRRWAWIRVSRSICSSLDNTPRSPSRGSHVRWTLFVGGRTTESRSGSFGAHCNRAACHDAGPKWDSGENYDVGSSLWLAGNSWPSSRSTARDWYHWSCPCRSCAPAQAPAVPAREPTSGTRRGTCLSPGFAGVLSAASGTPGIFGSAADLHGIPYPPKNLLNPKQPDGCCHKCIYAQNAQA
jgi:hypothetical protein